MPAKRSIDNVKDSILKIHGTSLSLDESTYSNTYMKARFVDKVYGEFWVTPKEVLRGHGHKIRGRLKAAANNTISANDMNKRIVKIHNNLVLNMEAILFKIQK